MAAVHIVMKYRYTTDLLAPLVLKPCQINYFARPNVSVLVLQSACIGCQERVGLRCWDTKALSRVMSITSLRD